MDIGPGAGEHGGQVVASRAPGGHRPLPRIAHRAVPLRAPKRSRCPHAAPGERATAERLADGARGAGATTSRDVDRALPPGHLHRRHRRLRLRQVHPGQRDILYRPWRSDLHRAHERPGAPRAGWTGMQHLDKVIDIDQSPIGRTPRSNPATYTGVYDRHPGDPGPGPGGPHPGLQAGALLLQRQGRALRGLPGGGPHADRDAVPGRTSSSPARSAPGSATTARRWRCASRG